MGRLYRLGKSGGSSHAEGADTVERALKLTNLLCRYSSGTCILAGVTIRDTIGQFVF